MLNEQQINKWVNSYQILKFVYPDVLIEGSYISVLDHVCCNGWALDQDIPCPFCGKADRTI
jgi:hypothetical protein